MEKMLLIIADPPTPARSNPGARQSPTQTGLTTPVQTWRL
jgi:hypothetical protein